MERQSQNGRMKQTSGTTRIPERHPALAVLGQVRDPRFRRRQSRCVAAASRSNSLLSPRSLEFRGSRQDSAPRAHVSRYGVCLGSLRLSEKPSTQTQLAIDG
jgi:hypothetical protein